MSNTFFSTFLNSFHITNWWRNSSHISQKSISNSAREQESSVRGLHNAVRRCSAPGVTWARSPKGRGVPAGGTVPCPLCTVHRRVPPSAPGSAAPRCPAIPLSSPQAAERVSAARAASCGWRQIRSRDEGCWPPACAGTSPAAPDLRHPWGHTEGKGTGWDLPVTTSWAELRATDASNRTYQRQ